MKTYKDLMEKTLTPAELKKREEIAKAMEKENPGMNMGKKMAIATAAAKRVAESEELGDVLAEGKDEKIAQLKKDHDTAVHWSKNETSPQKREAARQKAEKIKRHLDTQYKQGVSEGLSKRDQKDVDAIKAAIAGLQDKLKQPNADKEKIQQTIANEKKRLALYEQGVMEETMTVEEQAPEAPSIGVHRIAVTTSEPDHPAVSKRKETTQRFVRVTAHSKERAIEQGKKHFKKKGYKVHGAEHVGMIHEEVELEEGTFVYHMNKAIAAHDRGDENKKKMHLDNAKTARYALKSTDITKHKDLLDKYSQMRKSVSEETMQSTISFKEFQSKLDEAVGVEHDRYMRSHGKKATGNWGNWMFTHKRTGDVDYSNKAEVHSARGSFSDAKKSAQKWAKEHGHEKVYVMESFSEELDEEQIDELNKSTLSSYAKKATSSLATNAWKAGTATAFDKKNQDDERNKAFAKANKRMSGMNKAVDRLTKEEVDLDEEQLDELNKSTLGSYVKKATSSATANAWKAGTHTAFDKKNQEDERNKAFAKANKRMSGVNKAVDRLTKEEVESIDEVNHREFAEAGKMHPTMAKHMKTGNEIDFYSSENGDKLSGKVTKNDGKNVHVQANKDGKVGGGKTHKFAVSKNLNGQIHEENELDEGWKEKVGAGLVAAAMAAGAAGAAASPVHHAINHQAKFALMTKKMKKSNDAWEKITQRKAADKKVHEENELDEADYDWSKVGAWGRRTDKGSSIDWNSDKKSSSTDTGTVHKAREVARNPEGGEVQKRGRGRPAGEYKGTYKARDPESKAASSAKAQASKADGLAARKEFKTSMDAAIRQRQLEIWKKASKAAK